MAYPFNSDSTQERFYRLRLATPANVGSNLRSISPCQHWNPKFIIEQSPEKAPGQSSHMGINTRSGSHLTQNFRNLGACKMCHVALCYEQIVSLSAAGLEVLD